MRFTLTDLEDPSTIAVWDDATKILALKPGQSYTTSPSRFEEARTDETVVAFLARKDVNWSSDGTDKTVTVTRD